MPESAPRSGSWLSIALTISGFLFLAVLFGFLTLGFGFLLLAVAGFFFLTIGLQYLLCGWWLRQMVESQEPDDPPDSSSP